MAIFDLIFYKQKKERKKKYFYISIQHDNIIVNIIYNGLYL